jgi:hypothetical protein
MAWLKAISAHWARIYGAFKREFLRDPNVVLFNMGPDDIDRMREETLGLR